jgi:hypothetical protein
MHACMRVRARHCVCMCVRVCTCGTLMPVLVRMLPVAAVSREGLPRDAPSVSRLLLRPCDTHTHYT